MAEAASKGSLGPKRAFQQLWREFVAFVLGLLITVVTMPFYAFAVTISAAFRSVARLLAWVFRPDLSGIIKGVGIHFTLQRPYSRPKLVVILNLVFDGPISVERTRAAFEERILNYSDAKGKRVYSPFRQRWVQFCGFMFWKDDPNFKLENHIRAYDYTEPDLALPTPSTSEEDLKRITNGLLAKPFAEGRSPWEFLVINKFKSTRVSQSLEEQSVLMMRVHHGMADGYSLLRVIIWMLGSSEEEMGIPIPKYPQPSWLQKILQIVAGIAMLPQTLGRLALNSADGRNSWHLTDQKLSREYLSFYSDHIPMEDIKAIKNKFKVGYNTAAYAVAAGGIRRLMKAAGQDVPKKIACFVPYPLPNHPGGLVIHVSGIVLPIPLGMENAVQRLRAVAKCMDNSRFAGLICGWFAQAQSFFPVWIHRLFYNKAMTTLVMTSFPGSHKYADFKDFPHLLDLIPATGHMPGKTGALAVLTTMHGKQTIGLTVDKKIFASHKVPDNFRELVNEEVNELLGLKGNTIEVV